MGYNQRKDSKYNTIQYINTNKLSLKAKDKNNGVKTTFAHGKAQLHSALFPKLGKNWFQKHLSATRKNIAGG